MVCFAATWVSAQCTSLFLFRQRRAAFSSPCWRAAFLGITCVFYFGFVSSITSAALPSLRCYRLPQRHHHDYCNDDAPQHAPRSP